MSAQDGEAAPLGPFAGPRASEAANGLLVALKPLIFSGSRSQIPAVVVELIEALHASAVAHERGMFANEPLMTAPATIDESGRRWVPTSVAAETTGYTEQHITRLARDKRIRAQRIGARSWVVDPDDLDRHLRRRPA